MQKVKTNPVYFIAREIIGKEVKVARIRNNLTQAEVVAKGIASKQVIFDIEAKKGNPKLSTLIDILDGLHMDPNELVSEILEAVKATKVK